MALYWRGDLQGARVCFEIALGIDPSYPEGYNNRGLARQALGDLQGALGDFDRALALDSHYPEAFNNRALARQQLGDLKGALQDLDCALECVPRRSAALFYYNRGTVREANGDLPGARADFDVVLEVTPVHGPTWLRRGLVRKRLGDLAGARTDLDQALARSPQNEAAVILRERAAVRMLLGDAEAGADYLTAFHHDPARTVREIAQTVIEDARQEEFAVFDRCRTRLRSNPGDVVTRARLGLTLLALKRDQAAGPSLGIVRQQLPAAGLLLDQLVAEVLRLR
jgi:tetratricopeptide (TPR) repeat protein